MPIAVRVVAAVFGSLFFAAHLTCAAHAMRFHPTREGKLEAAGAVVPGSAGLLVTAAAVVAPPWWAIACLVPAVPLLVLGRAVYELVVFRDRGDRAHR